MRTTGNSESSHNDGAAAERRALIPCAADEAEAARRSAVFVASRSVAAPVVNTRATARRACVRRVVVGVVALILMGATLVTAQAAGANLPVGTSVSSSWWTGSYPVTQSWGPTSFSLEPPGHGYQHWHSGIDIGMPTGTQLRVPVAATVVAIGLPCFGAFAPKLRLDDGHDVILGHVESVTVSVGQRLRPGDIVAYSGNEGCSSGPHLHFEVRPAGGAYGSDVDPTSWLSVAPPPYAYRVVDQGALRPDHVTSEDVTHAFLGETGFLWVTVQNTGTRTWGEGGVPIRLGTAWPNDHASILAMPQWVGPGRPSELAPGTTIPPGGYYQFIFPIQVGVSSAASFLEHFNLVADGVTWFPDTGPVYGFAITKTVDRGIALRHHGPGGYALAPDGTVTPFGGAPALAGTETTLWPGWDVARGIVLRSDDAGGYVLDELGVLHGFGSAPGFSPPSPNFGFDIARSVVLSSDNAGGYVLDGYGAVHAFGTAPVLASNTYWPGWDVARSFVLTSNKGGFMMDGYGSLHPVGSPSPLVSTPPNFGFDIARAMVMTPQGTGGFTLDGYGGLHAFGTGTPSFANAPYWPGWDVAKAIASTSSAGSWEIDGAGGLHQLH